MNYNLAGRPAGARSLRDKPSSVVICRTACVRHSRDSITAETLRPSRVPIDFSAATSSGVSETDRTRVDAIDSSNKIARALLPMRPVCETGRRGRESLVTKPFFDLSDVRSIILVKVFDGEFRNRVAAGVTGGFVRIVQVKSAVFPRLANERDRVAGVHVHPEIGETFASGGFPTGFVLHLRFSRGLRPQFRLTESAGCDSLPRDGLILAKYRPVNRANRTQSGNFVKVSAA